VRGRLPPSFNCEEFEVTYNVRFKVKIAELFPVTIDSEAIPLTFVQRAVAKQAAVIRSSNDFDIVDFTNSKKSSDSSQTQQLDSSS
jgi:hypothetical protein